MDLKLNCNSPTQDKQICKKTKVQSIQNLSGENLKAIKVEEIEATAGI